MKAFMSDRDERPAGACDRLTCCNAILRGIDANAAVAEARRILTTVDEQADHVETLATLASDRARDIAWDEQTDAGDAARALAEALAAFVGDEQ